MSSEPLDPSSRRKVRIGGASGFWGDSMLGATQLVHSGLIDYLVFDYLAETTMAIMASVRTKKPEMGYATDFVDMAMKAVLPEVMQRGIKVVANAGGMNPQGCADALQALANSMGLQPKIAVVLGDDISAQLPALRDANTRDMYRGEPLPAKVLSANAYLGAVPVARALAEGADIVITGRGVDSAVTLGPLMHAFGWGPQDYDLLASGSLAGHIIECGCQATGGLHTDWQEIPDWPNIGYPIIDCYADGSFELHKTPGTGGKILRAAVAEQLLYEIGDPGAYLLPDVQCDFRQVHIEQLNPERVRVSGAVGRAPSAQYKVSATAMDGFRCTGSMLIIGIDAAAKARRTGEAILARTRSLLQQLGLPDFTSAAVDLLGAETVYGPHARAGGAREVMVRVIVSHPLKQALELFAKEISPAGTSWSPGTTGPGGGRPTPSPHIKPFSFLVDKASVAVAVRMGEQVWPVDLPAVTAEPAWHGAPMLAAPDAWIETGEPETQIPLIRLAWARSGDKGDISNIGLVARRPAWLPLLWARVTPEVVKAYFAHLVKGDVERFHLPGIDAMNLVMHQALGGGGPSSTRNDPLGKGMGQMLLDMPIRVPLSVAAGLSAS
jgi:hypothetical protein